MKRIEDIEGCLPHEALGFSQTALVKAIEASPWAANAERCKRAARNRALYVAEPRLYSKGLAVDPSASMPAKWRRALEMTFGAGVFTTFEDHPHYKHDYSSHLSETSGGVSDYADAASSLVEEIVAASRLVVSCPGASGETVAEDRALSALRDAGFRAFATEKAGLPPERTAVSSATAAAGGPTPTSGESSVWVGPSAESSVGELLANAHRGALATKRVVHIARRDGVDRSSSAHRCRTLHSDTPLREAFGRVNEGHGTAIPWKAVEITLQSAAASAEAASVLGVKEGEQWRRLSLRSNIGNSSLHDEEELSSSSWNSSLMWRQHQQDQQLFVLGGQSRALSKRVGHHENSVVAMPSSFERCCAWDSPVVAADAVSLASRADVFIGKERATMLVDFLYFIF